MPPDPNEFVRIKHPDIEAVGGPVTRASVDQTWRHLGWSILSTEEETSFVEAQRVADLTGQPAELTGQPAKATKAGKEK